MLRGAIYVECKPSSKHLAGEIKNKDDLLTIGPFVETLVAGLTMSIIKSFLVLGRLVARANLSVASGGNGRRATYLDRHTRLTAAPRERPGCSPASPPPEGTFCPSSRSVDGAGRAETVGHDRAIQTACLLLHVYCAKGGFSVAVPLLGVYFVAHAATYTIAITTCCSYSITPDSHAWQQLHTTWHKGRCNHA